MAHVRLRSRSALVTVLGWALASAVPCFAALPCGPNNVVNWCVHQETVGVISAAFANERFGAALAFGDFDADGFDDLAVGIPGEVGAGGVVAGAVQVFRGSATGLTFTGQLVFGQDVLPGDDGSVEEADEFGAALEVGDFNEDGVDDLAIGVPGEDVSGGSCGSECPDAGAIQVVYGGPGGLDLASAHFIQSVGGNEDQARLGTALAAGRFGPPGGQVGDDLMIGSPFGSSGGSVRVALASPEGLNQGIVSLQLFSELGCGGSTRRFGAALAVGRFDDQSHDNFVVADPACDVNGFAGAGAVGFRSGYSGAPTVLLQTDYTGAANAANDKFGAAMAVGNFDADSFDDLAVAAPFKNHGSGNPSDSGRVYVAYGSASGPDPSDGADIIGEDEWASSGDTPGDGELFGTGLAAGDVDDDGFDDLIVGAPGEGTFDVGRVYVKPGGPTGLTTVGNTLFTQTALGGQNATDDHLGTALALGDIDGDGVLELALGVPDKNVGDLVNAGMVYVTRILYLLGNDGFESGNTLAWSGVSP